MPDTETGAVAPDPRAILLESLWEDPRTRPIVAHAIETKQPGAVPGYHVGRLQQQMATEAARSKAINDANQKDRDTADLVRARASVTRVGLAATDVADVEKLMLDEGIATHATAAELLKRRRQETVASASRSRPGAWSRPGQDKADKWFEGVQGGPGIKDDRRGWAQDKAREMLADFEHQRSVGAI